MVSSRGGKINLRQQRFIEYFIISGLNGAEAARRAGYSNRSAKEIAYQLLQKPIIDNEIRRQKKLYGYDAYGDLIGDIHSDWE